MTAGMASPTAPAAPRVSVVIPVYDAGALLGRAVNSVERQTFRDFELVLVDDGSTDATTRRLLDGLAGRPGVTLHRTPNHGPAQARNLGVSHARGAWILPLDADDWLHPAFLDKTAAVLDANPDVAIAASWVRLVGGHSGVWKTGPWTLPAMLTRCTVHVTALYRRAVWERVGGYDPRFVESAEDWDFWLSAFEAGYRAEIVPEALVYYRRTSGGREQRARAPDVSARLMRTLVAKHRALYAAHLEEALAGIHADRTQLARALERVYDLPGIRWGVKLRERLRRGRTRG